MSNLGLFLLGALVIIIGTGLAADIPFIFDESALSASDFTEAQLESMRAASPYIAGVPAVSAPRDDEILEFPVTGGGNALDSKTEKKVIDLKNIFNSRVEPNNPIVRDKAVGLVARYPGDYTIDQISSIYTYLKEDWHYIRDPRGVDYYMYANETLKFGENANCIGAGDCDDFAILMSALVESVGGTTRIILACNNSTGGHAFAEVYLGKLDAKNSHVTEVINWLKQNYNIDMIYSHVDTDTKDVWLNLDWGADEKGNAHPGGPFYLGDKYMVICIRDQYGNTPLNVPENALPVATSLQRNATKDVAQQSRPAATALPFSLVSASPSDAIEADPTSAVDCADLVSAGQNAEAFGCFGRAIKADPTSAFDWAGLGDVMNNIGYYYQALVYYEMALNLKPDSANILTSKGRTLNRLGKYDEALDILAQALDLSPDNTYTWESIGDVYTKLGDTDKADAAYARAKPTTQRKTVDDYLASSKEGI